MCLDYKRSVSFWQHQVTISSLCSSTEPPNAYTSHIGSGLFRQSGSMYTNTYQSGGQRNMMQVHPQPMQAAMSVNHWPANPNLSLDSIRMNTSASNATVSHSNGASMQQQQQQQQQMHSSSAYTCAGEGTGNNSLPQLSMGDLACLDPEPQGQIRQEGQGAFGIRKATAACDQAMMQTHWNNAPQPCGTSMNGGGMGFSFIENLNEGDFLQSLIGTQPSTVLPKQEQSVAMTVQAPSASATADCQQSYTTLLSCSNNTSAQEAMRQMGKTSNGQSTIDQDTLWLQ